MTKDYNHYVPSSALRVSEEYGNPVVALCGYVWFPTGYRPELSICPVCVERAGLATP